MTIDIANESGAAVDEAALAALARFVLDQMRIHPLAELSVLLVDEHAMADLHERWMNEPGPTDVLAFPMDEFRSPQVGGVQSGKADDTDRLPEPLLGDVVLCPHVAAEQAVAAGHPAADELELLCTHGILHLLGYDHADPDEHATMFGLQDQILVSWHSSRERLPDEEPGTGHGPSPAGRSPGAERGAESTRPGAAGPSVSGRGAGGRGAGGAERGGQEGPG